MFALLCWRRTWNEVVITHSVQTMPSFQNARNKQRGKKMLGNCLERLPKLYYVAFFLICEPCSLRSCREMKTVEETCFMFGAWRSPFVEISYAVVRFVYFMFLISPFVFHDVYGMNDDNDTVYTRVANDAFCGLSTQV